MNPELLRNFQRIEDEAITRNLIKYIPTKDLAEIILNYLPDNIDFFASDRGGRYTIVTERGHLFQGFLGVFRYLRSGVNSIVTLYGVPLLIARSSNIYNLDLEKMKGPFKRKEFVINKYKRSVAAREFKSESATLTVCDDGRISILPAPGYGLINIVDYEVGVDSLSPSQKPVTNTTNLTGK